MNVAFSSSVLPKSRLSSSYSQFCPQTSTTPPPSLYHRRRAQWVAEIPSSRPSSTLTPVYKIEILRSVTELEPHVWDSFATTGCNSPFLHHHWLRCLEFSGCATVDAGWIPHHLVMRNTNSNEIVAIAPAYVKTNSLGEFVFDQEWAEAAYGAGIMYYPKLLLAVPFTPATGRRILTREDGTSRKTILRTFARALLDVVATLQLSSVHVNFCRQDEVNALSAIGFLQRKGVQYHFTNYKKGQAAISNFEQQLKEAQSIPSVSAFESIDAVDRKPYIDFEDYLSEFKSKRRIKMRRERQYVREDHDLQVEVVKGDQIDDDLMSTMFDIYKSTIDKMFYGRQYLSRQFFETLKECPEFMKHICLILARRRDNGQIVGGTFNIISDADGGAFYGRYWGCIEEYRYLHFETCYYASIEYCITNGLSRMEPGAGGGDFKYMRGFEPAITMSMHYLQDQRLADAVARYLVAEGNHIDMAVLQMKRESAIRSKNHSN